MATTPNSIITPQNIRTANAVCTAAKTTYGDAANAVAILSAQSNGAVIYKVTALPRATVTATQLQLFRSPDAGTTLFFVAAALMPAYTMATNTAPTATDFGFSESNPLRLGNTDALYVGAAIALASGIVFDVQMEIF
jgi:hypothetical protein